MRAIHYTDNDFNKSWEEGILTIAGATPSYSSLVRRYEREYFADSMEKDDSFVVLSDSNEISAIVPLYCFKDKEGKLEYWYSGDYLRAPLVCGEPYSRKYRKIQKFVFDYIECLAAKSNVYTHKAVIESAELLDGRHYYNFLIEFGYRDESAVGWIIDTSKNVESCWTDIRKSYKSLINRAAKTFNCEVISSYSFDFDRCEDYRKLHFKAAGRQTRSLESFYLMYNMIKSGQAFIILIREMNGNLAAAHFFYYSGVYCLYASSAVDPALPSNSGAGHLAIWQGLLTARKMGCLQFNMGQLWTDPNPSEKIKSIALFKKGFGGFPVVAFGGTKTFSC